MLAVLIDFRVWKREVKILWPKNWCMVREWGGGSGVMFLISNTPVITCEWSLANFKADPGWCCIWERDALDQAWLKTYLTLMMIMFDWHATTLQHRGRKTIILKKYFWTSLVCTTDFNFASIAHEKVPCKSQAYFCVIHVTKTKPDNLLPCRLLIWEF